MPAKPPARRLLSATAAPGRGRTMTARAPAVTEMEENLRHVQRLIMQGELAATAVHEISNLLTIVLFNAGLLRERLKEHPLEARYVEPLLHAATVIATLCGQLRDLSRPAEPRTKSLDLVEAAQGTFQLLEQIMPRKLVFSAPPDGPVFISADPAQIDQMLVNLVLNARDATREDSGRIAVRVGRGAGGRNFIEVADNGTGMTAAVKRQLFKTFFTTKPAGQGTGLGLVTVQRLIRGMGGTLELNSSVGRGTRIRLLFPVHTPPDDDASPVPESTQPATPAQPG